MLTKENKKIKISLVEAEKKAVFLREDTSFNVSTDELSFTINKATGANWRLIHDTKTVIALIGGTDKSTTTTIHDILEFKTKKEALDKIEELKLVVPDELIFAQEFRR